MARSFDKINKLTEHKIYKNLNDRVDSQNMRQDDISDTPAYKNFTIGLNDIDNSIQYFFDNVLKPTIIQDGKQLPVNVLYGSPERWNQMKTDGYLRDNKSKLLLPLILYKRNSVQKNDNIQFTRMDQLYYVTSRKWDAKNKYDNFSVLNGIKEKIMTSNEKITDKYVLTSIPNYVVVSYDVMLWTAFIEQMNKLIESIMYTNGTYWGEDNKFKFRTEIESFNTETEVTADSDRMVRTNFNITLYGYLLPEEVAGKLTSTVSLSPKKVTFSENLLY